MDLATLRIVIQAVAEGTEEVVSKTQKAFGQIEKAQENISKPIELSVNTTKLDEARKALSNLKKDKSQLEESLRLTYESSGLNKLKTELLETVKTKKELEKEIKIYADTDEIIKIKREISDVETEILKLQKTIRNTESRAERETAEKRIESLKTELKGLKELLNLEIKVDKDRVTSDLSKVKKEIDLLETEISIQTDASGINQTKSEIKNLETAIKDAEKAAKELEKAETKRLREELQEAEKSAKELEKGFTALAIAATAAFASIISSIKSGTATFTENTTALLGLQSVAESVGISISETEKAVAELSDEFFNSADAANALKNLLDKGFGLKEAITTIKRFKDAAATGKKSTVEFGQAVVSATEGVKNSNNTLLKTAGVLVNFSDAYASYAQSIGKTTNELTAAEKAQAEYNAILEATKNKIGDADKLADTLAGSQAAAANATRELSSAFGEALSPAVQDTLSIYSSATSAIANFISEHKTLTSIITTSTIAATAFVAILGAYVKIVPKVKSGLISLTTSLTTHTAATATATKGTVALDVATKSLLVTLGPLALLFAGIGVAVEGIRWVDNKQKEAIQLQKEHNQELVEYQLITEEINDANIDAYKKQAEDLSEALEILTKAMEEYSENEKLLTEYPRYAGGLIELKRIINETTEAWQQLGREEEITKEVLSDKAVLYDILANELEDTNSAIERHTNLQKTEINYLNQTQSNIKSYTSELKQLNSTYSTLAKGEQLSIDNLIDLIQKYPAVAKEIAENVNWRETLIDVIDDERNAKKAALIDELEQQKALITARRQRLESYLESLKTEAKGHGISYSNQEKDLVSYGNKVREVIENIENRAITEVSTDKTWESTEHVIETLVQERIDELKAEEDALNDAIEALKNIDIRDYQSSGTRGASGAAKKEVDEFKEIWDEYQHYQKIGYFKNLKDQQEWINSKLQNVKKTTAQERQLIEENYNINKQIGEEALNTLEKYYSEWTKIGNKAYSVEDIETYIAALKRLEVQYKDLGDEYKEYADERIKITEAIAEAEEDLTNKITENARKQTDELVAQEERRAALLKSYSGLRYGTEEDEVYKYTEQDEIQSYRRRIATYEGFINDLMSRREELTEYEIQQLEAAQLQVKGYYENIEDIVIQSYHTQQKEIENTYKERQKALDAALKEEEAAYKAQTSKIKSEYAERIQAAKDAASEEVEALRDKIKEIDRLLNQQSIDELDAEYERKKAMLEKVFEHEVDDSNKYELQKELANLTAEYEKRKNKEALQAQKDALQEEINNLQNASSDKVSALEKERDAEISAIEDALESKKALYEKETKSLEEEMLKRQAAVLKHAEIELDETEETVLKKAEQYEKDTENFEGELDNQYEGVKVFTTKVKKKYKEHTKETKDIVEDTVSWIIRFLNSKIGEYAEAGRKAGQAYADAFFAAASGAISYIGGRSIDLVNTSHSIADAMDKRLIEAAKAATALTMERNAAIAAANAKAAPTSIQGVHTEPTKNDITVNMEFNQPFKSPTRVARETKRFLEDALKV